MNNYLIRYDNSINSMFPVDLTKLEMNAFMYILSGFNGNDNDELVIPYQKIREIIRYNPKRTAKDFEEMLEKLCKKLKQVTLLIGNDKEDGDYCVFPTFIRNWYEQHLTVALNPHARQLLNIPKCYTQFDIREFISLKSKAAKFIFINLKQFRSTGIWHVSMAEFKKRLGAGTYSNNNCIQKLIIPAIAELNDRGIFDSLDYKIESERSPGSPVRSVVFTFTPEKRSAVSHGEAKQSISKPQNEPMIAPKQETASSQPQKGAADPLPEVIDSLYCTAEALLKGRVDNEGIDFISKEARRCEITPFILKKSIYTALGRDNVANLVGYIITLIRKSRDQNKSFATDCYMHAFHNFNERSYDYAALEREVLGLA